MKRLVWLSDIHLDFFDRPRCTRLIELVEQKSLDGVIISGDISTAMRLNTDIAWLDRELQLPICFVLGNHDFYGGSIGDTREQLAGVLEQSPNLIYLSQAGVVGLTKDTCLIGHDSWADARLGDPEGTPVELNDFVLIRELTGLTRQGLNRKLNTLGDEAATYIRTVLPTALATYRHVVLVTHVPPFREACWHEGRISDSDWLPYFACRAFGEAIREAAVDYAGKITVLCGHTHSPGEAQILHNLHVLTAKAEYGMPMIQRVFEFE